MAVQEKLLTAEEFANLPDNDKHCELVKGGIIETPLPPAIHGMLQGQIGFYISSYLRLHDIGYTGFSCGCILTRNPDTVRGPDIFYISKVRWTDRNFDAYLPMGPDLVVEIIAPSDLLQEINLKIREYFEAGTRLLWLVQPYTQQVHVYHGFNSDIQVVGIDEVLDGEDVLPGFTLSMRDLFKGMTNED